MLALASSTLLTLAIAGSIAEAAGYLLFDPVTRHRHALVLVALVIGLAAAITFPSRERWSKFVRGSLAAGLVVALMVGAAWAALLSGFRDSRHPSPDGQHVLVVSEGAAMIDPLWLLSVRESSWAVARTMPLACFNGDAPGDSLTLVTWVDGMTIEAVTDSGAVHRMTIGGWTESKMRFVSVGCDGLVGIP